MYDIRLVLRIYIYITFKHLLQVLFHSIFLLFVLWLSDLIQKSNHMKANNGFGKFCFYIPGSFLTSDKVYYYILTHCLLAYLLTADILLLQGLSFNWTSWDHIVFKAYCVLLNLFDLRIIRSSDFNFLYSVATTA